MKLKSGLLVGGLLFGLMPLAAQAGLAVGGSVGSARFNHGDFVDEGRDTGWKLFGGFYDTYVGAEVAYIDFGADTGDARTIAPAVLVGMPLGQATFYGKAGVSFADIKGENVGQEYKDEDPFYGVGARIGSATGVSFRFEYERFRFDNQDADLASAGLEFRF